MARKKSLKLDKLVQEDQSKKKVHELELKDGVSVYYTTSLGKKGLDALLTELFETIKYAGNNKLEYPLTYEHAVEYLQYLIFKHFTNISDELGFDYPKNILLFESAYDNYWIDQLLTKVPQHQVNKVYDEFNTRLKLEIEHQKLLSEAVEKLQKDVTNQEALKILGAVKDGEKTV